MNKKKILIVSFFILGIFTKINGQYNEPLKFPDENTVRILSETINTPYYEYTPFIMPDESTLYFQSDRPGSIGGYGDFDIWVSENKNNSFSIPINPGSKLNSKDYQGTPSLRINAENNLEIYYTIAQSPNQPQNTQTDLYYSVYKDGRWIEPIPLYTFNTPFHERMPSISRDGKTLYFSSDRPGGFGKDDIWVSFYNTDKKKWEKPQNAGDAINTISSEISPSAHPDNTTLYFASNKKESIGGYDIYVTQKLPENEWGQPKNLGKPYNTRYDEEYPSVTLDGKTMYFTSNRPGGYGKFDIYQADVPEHAKPKVIIYLEGRILEQLANSALNKGIEANITIKSRGKDYRNISTSLPGGKFDIPLQNDRIYLLTLSAAGFESKTVTVDLRDEHVSRVIEQNYFLKRIPEIPTNDKKNIRNKDVLVKIAFYDIKNNALKPLFESKQIMAEKEEIEKFSFDSMNQYYYQGYSKEELDMLINNASLYIHAQLDEFQEFEQTIKFSDIIKKKDNQYPKEVTIKITLNPDEDYIKKTLQDKKPVEEIYFPYNKHNMLSPNEKKKLDTIIANIKRQQPDQIILHGHADRTGPEDYNTVLSKKRALFIKNYLIKNKIPENKIVASWFGERKNIITPGKKYNASENRRVKIFFINKNTTDSSAAHEKQKE